jgi:hypothetical protein
MLPSTVVAVDFEVDAEAWPSEGHQRDQVEQT